VHDPHEMFTLKCFEQHPVLKLLFGHISCQFADEFRADILSECKMAKIMINLQPKK
jgi:hypothetical protein